MIEILISMFVLLFGLMGVAAIFPVGNHYVQQGENFDLGAGIAQNAFEELTARGILRPEVWLYAGNPPNQEALDPTVPMPLGYPPQRPLVIQDEFGPNNGSFNVADPAVHPGRAFVIDPLGAAAGIVAGLTDLDVFPYFNIDSTTGNALNTLVPTPWQGAPGFYGNVRWPVRRVSIPVPDSTGTFAFRTATTQVGETIFRLRDDLAVEQPDESDVPSIQRWDIDTSGAAPQLLRRQYKGDYSWLATVVPTTGEALAALQPAREAYGEIRYDVSVVVFRKRVFTPSVESERLIEAELLPGGELLFFDRGNSKQAVDDALDDVRSGNWISLMGVNQTTGDFVMKWYRLLTLDTKEETLVNQNINSANNVAMRRAMLIGPDWPETPTALKVASEYAANLRAAILPGAVSVVTKQLKMEDTSLWSLE